MLEVAEGEHTYAITTSVEMAVRPTTARRLKRRFAAAAEEPVDTPPAAEPVEQAEGAVATAGGESPDPAAAPEEH